MTSSELLALIVSFKSWAVWVLVGIVAAFGALGGWAHRLVTPAENEPVWPRSIVVGAVAALGVLFVFGPTDPIKLIALAVVAGYGGKSVLDALENRVKAAAAQAETTRAKSDGQQAAAAAREAIAAGQRLAAEIQEGLGAPEGVHAAKAAAPDLAALPEAASAARETWNRLEGQLDSLEARFKN